MQPGTSSSESSPSLGPYQLLEPLGAGGMGTVYRARHAGTGQLVALKTVRLLEAASLRGLRREVRALGRLRHPGIIRVLDEGVAEGLPWYAMELLEGPTLREQVAGWWHKAPGGPRQAAAGRLPEALGLLHRVCSALGFLHGEGIVHRDLKPENVVVRPGGQPVLVDFGLVSAFSGAQGREALEVAGTLEGSFGYMAPEQIRGELVDARADLYALGCVLYEIVAGRPPFAGEGWPVLRRHLVEPPEPLSHHVEGVPAALEELVQRLLAKQPRERLGYASDVAAVLAGLGAVREEGAAPAPRAYLYRPEFVGRRALVAELERLLDETRLGRGRCVLLSAESGAGKTRLAMEVATAANRLGLRVLTGECSPLESSALQPLRPLLQAVADHCREQGAHAAESLLGPYGSLLALYEPTLARLSPQDSGAPPAPLPTQEARQRLLEAAVYTLSAFAAEQPLLLVLDDLQWADELSLGVLEQLLRRGLERLPLVVLGTCRSEEDEPLRALERLPGLLHRRVERLYTQDVADMVSGMLALPGPPQAFVDFLARQSEGNPFFVAEYLRTAVDEGLLGRSAEGRWQPVRGGALERMEVVLPLPGSLRELLERWLRGLRPQARALVEHASVLGREFDSELLASSEEPGVLEALEALRVRQVLEEGGGGRLRFTHDKLRELAYERTEPAHRQHLHAQVAQTLEARHTRAEERVPLSSLLAHHWLEARQVERALPYLEAAARHALRLGAYAEAAGHLERALALGGAQRQATWEQLLGEARFGLGDLARAQHHLARALRGLGQPLPGGRPAWAGRLLGQVARQAAHLLLPSRRVEERNALQQEVLRTAALAAGRLCQCYYFTQDMLALSASAVLAVNLAEQAGSGHEVRPQYAQLGYMVGLARLHPLARLYFRRAREGHGAEAELAGIATALWYESSYEATFGRWAQAAQRADEAIQLLESLCSPGDLQVARTLRAHADYYTGHFEASLPRFEQIRESARRSSHVQYEAWGLYSLARSLVALGRLEEALGLLQQARDLIARQADRASEVICHGLLATAHLYRGELEAAVTAAEEVLRLTAGVQPTAFTEGRGYEGAALALLAAWERAPQGLAARPARQAREAVARLARLAQMFPLARPAALRCEGQVHWLSGHPRRARALWAQSTADAQALGMPYDEALAWWELARHGEPGTPEQRHSLHQATQLLSRLGCAGHLRQL